MQLRFTTSSLVTFVSGIVRQATERDGLRVLTARGRRSDVFCWIAAFDAIRYDYICTYTRILPVYQPNEKRKCHRR